MIKWLDTTGGPIIILPAVEVENWSGCYSTDSISAKKIIDAEDFLNPNETDYGKACQIEVSIGIINFSNSKAIALGDEPLWTTFIKNKKTKL